MAGVRVGLMAAAIALTLLAGASPASADGARIVAEKQIKPRQIELTIETPAFTEPTHVDVDLPTGYDADPSRRWPVTYVLAGTMNTYRTFNSFVNGLKLSEAYPSIIVSPNGDSGYWSDWYNGGAFGPPMYETYVIRQLIPLIDAHYRTIADRSQRAVFGISMGGYGAMMVAARHPDLFAAAATLSGAVDSNLPTIGAALSTSPTFQGGAVDAIYGPRSTQEVRWRGHNPTDLADNLRDLDLQVRSANGVPNPGIGEQPASADTVSCVVEGGVYMATVDFNAELDRLKIPHLWKDYGAGCHTVPNFRREIVDTLSSFTQYFAHPRRAPATFSYKSIEPAFDIYGWHIAADPKRALEFMQVDNAGASGLTLTGSGTTSVTTPPLFAGLKRVDVAGGAARPDGAGRIRFDVDLGPADSGQQYAVGSTTEQISRTVKFAPYALVKVTRARTGRRGAQVCAHAVGGQVVARLRATGARSTKVALGPKTVCRNLRWTRRTAPAGVGLSVSGHDAFGHAVRLRMRTRP